jgi:hypothetical protein
LSAYTYRRLFPVLIIAIVGLLALGDSFLKFAVVNDVVKELKAWGVILAAFTLGLGTVDSFLRHWRNIQTRREGIWQYSIVTLSVIIIIVVLGLTLGDTSDTYVFLYENLFVSSDMTLQTIAFFWSISAMLRAFRARSIEAAAMVIAGVIALLAPIPLTGMLLPFVPPVSSWLVETVTLGPSRGLIIAAAVGAVAVGIRTLLGYEKGALPEEAGGD